MGKRVLFNSEKESNELGKKKLKDNKAKGKTKSTRLGPPFLDATMHKHVERA